MTARELDALLGDPADAGNPVGHAAVLAADERQEMLDAGERLLDRYGLNAEFVPARYGGRLVRADRLAEVLRTVWRRDPCLGLGYGLSSFIAGVNVWSSGDEEQRARVAALLLGNQRIAAAFHELDHGNDFTHADFTARAAGDDWLLSGRKEVVTNLRRSSAVVLFARTDDAPGSRSHSQFLVVKDELPAGSTRNLPRHGSSGMNGVQLGAMAFTDCRVPGRAMLGRPGHGVEIALRSYQVTRALLPSIIVGPLDAALRTTVDFTQRRRLYGGVAGDIPYVRSSVARVFADLLCVDALSSVGLRALHLVPESMSVYSPAGKYLASRIVLDAFEDLGSVLGAAGYLREGPAAVFQKLARDIAPATFAHISRAACLTTLLPQLPRLARRSWLIDRPADAGLFDLSGDLPELRFDGLSPGAVRTDVVAAVLGELAEGLVPGGSGAPDPVTRRFAVRFRDELRALSTRCAELRPTDLTIDAAAPAFALADRYTVLLAAAAALAVWAQDGHSYPVVAQLAVLDRLNARLGGDSVLTEPERERIESHMFDLVVERYQEHRLFDLTGRPTAG
jgi:alkylation response protein AidB-like acyl-CoA dehydrogenase